MNDFMKAIVALVLAPAVFWTKYILGWMVLPLTLLNEQLHFLPPKIARFFEKLVDFCFDFVDELMDEKKLYALFQG